jgi:hypothetical protein
MLPLNHRVSSPQLSEIITLIATASGVFGEMICAECTI